MDSHATVQWQPGYLGQVSLSYKCCVAIVGDDTGAATPLTEKCLDDENQLDEGGDDLILHGTLLRNVITVYKMHDEP